MTEQKYVVLEGSKVVNIILWDDSIELDAMFEAPEGHTFQLVTGDEGIGWELVDGEWVAPINPEPPAPTEDPVVLDAKLSALQELTDLGVSEKNARIIVGLPPAEEEPTTSV
ncbi:hypothetical protein SEA_MAKAI_24 [Arthrobacter phage Makai]|nr:hypothetical protein SEA_MAKAI_24 [Arthrobacter phage Makai]QPX62487.1 hypothetical protein SEA_TRUCKEE_23 [Arthrobacter phage Truckee]